MEIDLNEVIKLKVKMFEECLSNKTDSEKRLFHYKSVINISNRIVLYNDKKAEVLKGKLLLYFEEIDSSNYLVNNKLKSSNFYKYLLPIDQYLTRKDQFITSTDLHIFFIIGLIVDTAIFILLDQYYYPLFIFLFLTLGIYRRKQAKKDGKYAAMFW